MLRILALTLAAAVALIVTEAASAQRDPIDTRGPGGKVAVDGHDTVAYFTVGEPVKGDKNISATWKGAKFLFSSEENKALFEANPEKYAPQYGGYCAWAMASGGFADGDARFWKIVDGKLYLNYTKKVQAKWEEDISGFIAKADPIYPTKIAESN